MHIKMKVVREGVGLQKRQLLR